MLFWRIMHACMYAPAHVDSILAVVLTKTYNRVQYVYVCITFNVA